MKIVLTIAALAAVSALTTSPPASAQPVSTSSATAPAADPKFTLDTPIETIAADPAGKAVLDKDIPGLTTHDSYDAFKSMSLKAVQPMSSGAITDAALTKVAADLAALK